MNDETALDALLRGTPAEVTAADVRKAICRLAEAADQAAFSVACSRDVFEVEDVAALVSRARELASLSAVLAGCAPDTEYPCDDMGRCADRLARMAEHLDSL